MPHKANKIQINNIKHFILKNKYNIYLHKDKSKKQKTHKNRVIVLDMSNYSLFCNKNYDMFVIDIWRI